MPPIIIKFDYFQTQLKSEQLKQQKIYGILRYYLQEVIRSNFQGMEQERLTSITQISRKAFDNCTNSLRASRLIINLSKIPILLTLQSALMRRQFQRCRSCPDYQYHLLTMYQSTSSRLILVVLAVCIITATSADSCTSANSTTCGVGSCAGFVMVKGTCTSSCADGSYYQNATGSCSSCSVLSQSDCSMNCPGFYYVPSANSTNGTNGTNTSCISCSGTYGVSCNSCNTTQCLACATGFSLSANSLSCINAGCNVTNCITCAGPASCYLCQAGFMAPNCVAAQCTVNYCSTCSGSSCSSCVFGYTLTSNGTCVPTCGSRCTNCISPGVCAQCESGYVLNNSTYTCQVDCSLAFGGNCQSCDNLIFCSICKSGYIPLYNGLACQLVVTCNDSKCTSCPNATSICATCATGYTLSSNFTCTQDICSIQYCKVCSTATTCLTCDDLFTPSGRTCSPTCATNITNCKICNSTNSCSFCAIGYKVSANGTQCINLCSITNCSSCLSETYCLSCASGYTLSSDRTSCSLQCGDRNCDTCLTSTNCSKCNSGFTVGTSGRCQRTCREGFVLNVNSTCQLCGYVINYCQNCVLSSTNSTQCTECLEGYYLSSGQCFQCSSVLANCILCSSPSACTRCTRGYTISSTGTCETKANCTARNCEICQANSTTLCATCSTGFTLSNSTCNVVCTSGKLLINSACACPFGSYEGTSGCVACSDSNCLTCTSTACSSCIQRFYASGAACVACPSNCQACDSISCYYCVPPYTLSNNTCTLLSTGVSMAVDSTGAAYTCDPGCDSCSIGDNKILVCNIITAGYSKVQGKIIRCDPSCRTCSNSPTTCLSCFPGTSLYGGACVTCTDTYAISCSTTDSTFSLSCKSGYTAYLNNSATPSTSVCTACAQNCNKCDINGAGNCDPGQCHSGFVQQTGLTNCTKCFDGCPYCDPDNLMTCLACGQSRFSSGGRCASCPTGCKTCTSATNCSDCYPGFISLNSLCIAGPVWPCIGGTSAVCTRCVNSYVLTNGSCVYNSDCNNTATCTSCVYGYYLSTSLSSSQGSCFACPTIANCLTCDRSNSSQCFLCNTGFYIGSNNTCVACTTGCSQCSGASSCLKAQSGYFLLMSTDGSYSGQTRACTSPCLTCANTPDYCLTCVTGFSLDGTTCFSNRFATYKTTFRFESLFSSSSPFATIFGILLRRIGFLNNMLSSNLPARITGGNKRNTRCFKYIGFRAGSVEMETAISAENYDDPSTLSSDLSSANLLPGATVLSTSVSAGGFTSSDSSSTNLGLIIGVAVPLGILLIIIIAIIVYSKKAEEGAAYYENERVADTDKNLGNEAPKFDIE